MDLLASQAPSIPPVLQPPPPPRLFWTVATAVRVTEGDSPVAHSTEDELCVLSEQSEPASTHPLAQPPFTPVSHSGCSDLCSS